MSRVTAIKTPSSLGSRQLAGLRRQSPPPARPSARRDVAGRRRRNQEEEPRCVMGMSLPMRSRAGPAAAAAAASAPVRWGGPQGRHHWGLGKRHRQGTALRWSRRSSPISSGWLRRRAAPPFGAAACLGRQALEAGGGMELRWGMAARGLDADESIGRRAAEMGCRGTWGAAAGSDQLEVVY
jgi:hypothetical protein